MKLIRAVALIGFASAVRCCRVSGLVTRGMAGFLRILFRTGAWVLRRKLEGSIKCHGVYDKYFKRKTEKPLAFIINILYNEIKHVNVTAIDINSRKSKDRTKRRIKGRKKYQEEN